MNVHYNNSNESESASSGEAPQRRAIQRSMSAPPATPTEPRSKAVSPCSLVGIKCPTYVDDAPVTADQIASAHEAIEDAKRMIAKTPDVDGTRDNLGEPTPAPSSNQIIRVELPTCVDDAPVPAVQIAAAYEAIEDAKRMATKTPDADGTAGNFGEPMSAASSANQGPPLQDEPSHGDRHVAVEIRPPPPCMVDNQESSDPSLLLLEATVVPELPVYDAVVSDQKNDEPPTWWKRHNKHVLVGLVLFVLITIAAAIIGIFVGLVGLQNKNDGSTNDGSTQPTTSILLYYADRKANRCYDFYSSRQNISLEQQGFETVEECCETEFWHLHDDECIINSFQIDIPHGGPQPSVNSTTTILPMTSELTTHLSSSTLGNLSSGTTTTSATVTTSTTRSTNVVTPQTPPTYRATPATPATFFTVLTTPRTLPTTQQTTTGNPSTLPVSQAPVCSDEYVNEVQSKLIATDEELYAGIICKCVPSSAGEESADITVSCTFPVKEECVLIDCSEGWECTNPSSTVTVCTASAISMTVNSDGSIIQFLHRNEFISGVANVQSITAVVEPMNDFASCNAYFIDDQACTSCEICVDAEGVWYIIADCSNVIAGAISNCEQESEGFLKSLFVLESITTTATIEPSAASTQSNGIDINNGNMHIIMDGEGISIKNGNMHIIKEGEGTSIYDGENYIELNDDGISMSDCTGSNCNS